MQVVSGMSSGPNVKEQAMILIELMAMNSAAVAMAAHNTAAVADLGVRMFTRQLQLVNDAAELMQMLVPPPRGWIPRLV